MRSLHGTVGTLRLGAQQIGFDLLMVKLFGFSAFLYFLASTFMAGSLHPMAGHFIAEHYVFEGTAETYSYYGPLNMLACGGGVGDFLGGRRGAALSFASTSVERSVQGGLYAPTRL